MFKSKTTQKIEEKLNKKKGNTDMKKQIIITVAITLSVVAAFVATFILGMNYQNSQNAQVEAKAQTIVKNVQVEVQTSKK